MREKETIFERKFKKNVKLSHIYLIKNIIFNQNSTASLHCLVFYFSFLKLNLQFVIEAYTRQKIK